MIKRPDIASLLAGVALALAACVLVAIHTAVPSFLPFAVLTLLGIAGGVTLPTPPTTAAVPAASTALDVPAPVAVPVVPVTAVTPAAPPAAAVPVIPTP